MVLPSLLCYVKLFGQSGLESSLICDAITTAYAIQNLIHKHKNLVPNSVACCNDLYEELSS